MFFHVYLFFFYKCTFHNILLGNNILSSFRRLLYILLKSTIEQNFEIIRDYYMTFSISALVLTRDSHIKPDSEAGGLIWVEGWYQGPYGKFHVIIFLSHILHWPFPSIDFYIAKKIYEQTNCENKSLRELPLFNLQIFLFRIWFQKYTKQCRSIQWR